MALAELKSNNVLHAMKSGQKVGKTEEGNDSLDNYIRQAIGKEPVLSFSRPENSHVQWIQLLQALDQQDLPGWPLLSPPKVQMQKCDKCTREFCSPINYRRHIRLHRRSLKINKDSTKNRDFLGAFWDKLSVEEAKEVVSFKNVTLEDVPGLTVIKALTSFIRKPGFSSLPQVYVKAGAALLDVVQARPFRFPISAEELFNILDDASEKTFLCAGTAESLQKFVFDGEAGKIGLEMKNLIACTSFLMEQKLVKAWHADKDAEALRCEKLLVEEEEAAQKRQAELLERKRLKKLKQKEQKAKEQADEAVEDFKEDSLCSHGDSPCFGETSTPFLTSDLADPVQQDLQTASVVNTNEEGDSRCHSEFDDAHVDLDSGSGGPKNSQNVDQRVQQGSGLRHQVVARRPVSSSQRGGRNSLHLSQALPKLGPVQKGMHRDQRVPAVANGHKVWTRKTKSGHDGENVNATVVRESRDQPELNENREFLIGSISVTIPAAPVDQCAVDHQQRHKNSQEKHVKPDSGQSGANKSMVRLWRPVSRHGNSNTTTSQGDKRYAEVDTVSPRVDSPKLSIPPANDNNVVSRMDSVTVVDESGNPGLRLFSSSDAEAFLTQRWKEAVAADHLRLVLSSEREPPDSSEVQDAPLNPEILRSAENRLPGSGSVEPAMHVATAKTNFKAKAEKNVRLKYIPKQKNST